MANQLRLFIKDKNRTKSNIMENIKAKQQKFQYATDKSYMKGSFEFFLKSLPITLLLFPMYVRTSSVCGRKCHLLLF